MKRLIGALLFAAFAVTAAGCTATQGNSSPPQGAAATSRPAPVPAPDRESFTRSACAGMTEDVFGVWNMAIGLEDKTTMTLAERHELKTRQDALIAAMHGAPPEVRKSLDKLVNKMGWVRFLYDTGNYKPAHMTMVLQADSAMQDACVH